MGALGAVCSSFRFMPEWKIWRSARYDFICSRNFLCSDHSGYFYTEEKETGFAQTLQGIWISFITHSLYSDGNKLLYSAHYL